MIRILIILFCFFIATQALSVQIATGTYVGDSSNPRGITGVGFQPDVVIVFSDVNQRKVWKSNTMGVYTKVLSQSSYDNDIITSLDADGFTITADILINWDTKNYYYIAFRDDGNNDIHIGTYVGDGNDDRNITAPMGFTPDFILVGADELVTSYWKTKMNTVEATIQFIAGAFEATDHVQAFIANGFQVGTSSNVNHSGRNYHYFCLKEISGLIKFGSYTGDSNDNRNITGVGFQPDEVWIKGDHAGIPVAEKNAALDDVDKACWTDDWAPQANIIQDIIADGFQLGDENTINWNGNVYLYVAFKAGQSQKQGRITVIIN